MKCSVIVPTYNRVEYLKRTIESLRIQDYPDKEIIIVDDGSYDGTKDYLDRISDKNIFVIHQANYGPAMARNAGIQKAAGEIIAFTDDDCILPPDWISKFMGVFKNPGIGFAGGLAVNKAEYNFFSEISQEITNHFVYYFAFCGQSTSFLTSNNIAYRSDILRESGGFDRCFRRPGGEERALNNCIIKTGMKGFFIKNQIIEHYHEMNLYQFFKQQRNYGRGSFLLFNVIGPKFRVSISPIPKEAYFSLFSFWLNSNILTGLIKIFFFFIIQTQILTGYFLEYIDYFMRKKVRNTA